jgi:SAM-dependent methyltransferase
MMRGRVILACVVSCLALANASWAQEGRGQARVTPPPMTAAQQERIATLAPDAQIYEQFRYWVSFQPPAIQSNSLPHYDAVLTQQGVSPSDRRQRLETIETEGRRLEVARWNRILTANQPSFNTKPNGFLVDITKGRRPGRALDVGMGQGRNALYLAEQGWDVTGFDPADQAVAAARAEAGRRNLRLTTEVVGEETFKWGKEQWDLIVLSYVLVRPYVRQIIEALAPGGLVVVEASHRDATKTQSIGAAVVYDSNELLKMFEGLRIIRYEDEDAEADFGPRGNVSRVVRLAAQKQ